jgi:hypothetical protein
MGTEGSLAPGVKRQGREADHSPPPCAEVKNGRDIPPLPIFLHGIVLNYIIKNLCQGTLLGFVLLNWGKPRRQSVSVAMAVFEVDITKYKPYTSGLRQPARYIFSLLPIFWKNEVGLSDHAAVRVCVCVCVCVCKSPLLTFERLNQSSWNLVRISRHLSPSQRPN